MATLIVILAFIGLGAVIVGVIYGVRLANEWLMEVIDERAYDRARDFHVHQRHDDRRMNQYLIDQAIKTHEDKEHSTNV